MKFDGDGMESQNEFNRLEDMRAEIAREKERKKYNTGEPWEPMKRPRKFARVLVCFIAALLIVAVFVAAVSFVAAKNSGQEFNVLGLFSL